MMRDIEDVLRRNMGLEASSIGTATVEQAVRNRMTQTGTATMEDYLRRLRDSPAELEELIEAVVVPESWFFRDGTPFAVLARWVREEWQPVHPGATLRVLTVPCSTGEEPYTVAMTLLDAGLPPERFTVDAVDISRRAVARARRAVYGANSFRGEPLDFRDRHFTKTPEGYVLADEVRRPVRFETGNILAADFRPGTGRFDVIFCRNLLIYFDRPTQAQAVKALGRMLAPDGLLFVGHAESQVAASAGYVSANHPRSFAFRPASVPAPAAALPPGRTLRLPPVMPQPRVTFRAPAKMPAHTIRVSPPLPRSQPPAPPMAANLDVARALADRGKLDEAARQCEEHLRQHDASAAAWYLLGVVRDAAGDRQRAAECYSKTLYLEPDHQDALLQRALLAEQTGDAATAAQLRRRMARVQQRSIQP